MKDLFLTVDYLTTSEDIDVGKLGYFSVSMGASLAPVWLSLEPRIRRQCWRWAR